MPRVRRKQPIISRKGGDRIGSYLWWTLREIEIERGQLQRLLETHGLDVKKHMPPPIVGHAAFRKAIAACKHGDRNRLVRFIKETPQEIIYGVVREDIDEAAEDLRYKVRARIVYRKRTESVVIRGGRSPVAEEVKKLFDEYVSTYIHTDIRRWIVRQINEYMQAVALKLNGGVYFIPHQHTAILRKLNSVVDDLPGRSEFIVTPIFDSKETTTSVGKATRGALEEELSQIRVELEEFRNKPPRRDTLKRRLEDFQRLKSRARMFADMLSFTVEDLQEGIDDCNEVVKALIGQVEAEVLRKAEERKARRRKGYKAHTRYVRKTEKSK